MPLRVLSAVNPEKVNKREHDRDIFIPLRNLSLISLAGSYATLKGIKHIAIGSLGIYPFFDNNAEYMNKLQSLMRMEILVPFMGLEKEEVVKRFARGVPLHMTLSCIRPERRGSRVVHCGRCEKCRERQHLML